MINIPTRIAIGMTALAVVLIVLASISFADNQSRKEDIKLTQNHLARQMEIWEGSRMQFRYHAMELKVKMYDDYYEKAEARITELEGDLIVQTLSKIDAWEEIEKMVFYINIMGVLADQAGITFPKYVIESEE